jgi:hypothetical protein
MKYTYKKMASGGSVKKEKGYTAKERKGLQSLIEELADPYAGDVTGGSSVTSTKKPKKRMAAGGIVGRPARSYKDMKAGAGSGVGRLQKTKIARGR